MSIAQMSNKHLKTRRAFEAFQRGDYAHARLIYQALADQIGEAYFKINIEICTNRLLDVNSISGKKPVQYSGCSPLKSYTSQLSLNIDKSSKIDTPLRKSEDVLINTAKYFEIKQDVASAEEYVLTAKCMAKGGGQP